jgi:hypothetical protein
MNKIKSFADKYMAKISAAALALGLGIKGAVCHAATDTDLQAGLDSITGTFIDNKGIIIAYVVGVIAGTFIISLIIKATFFGKNQGLGLFGEEPEPRMSKKELEKWEQEVIDEM